MKEITFERIQELRRKILNDPAGKSWDRQKFVQVVDGRKCECICIDGITYRLREIEDGETP